MKRVLFVCLGNICRSPAAEGVFLGILRRAGLSSRFVVDSAGTGDWHIGALADPRMRKAAKSRGYELEHKARQFVVQDFQRFDRIYTMDEHNYQTVLAKAKNPDDRPKVIPFVRLLSAPRPEIPDPYYGLEDDFELVLDLLEEGLERLLLEWAEPEL